MVKIKLTILGNSESILSQKKSRSQSRQDFKAVVRTDGISKAVVRTDRISKAVVRTDRISKAGVGTDGISKAGVGTDGISKALEPT